MYYCNIIYFKQIFVDGYEYNANNMVENSNVNFCSNINDDNENEVDISRHSETDTEISRNKSNHNIYNEECMTKLRKILRKTQMQCNIWKKSCENQMRYLKQ